MRADESSMARLMRMAQKGDKQAYSSLLGECQLWLGAYFANRVAPCQRDDLIQETLVSVHRKRASWDSKRAFLPWLAAIARYRWVDHMRKVYRAQEDELDETLIGDDNEPAIAARISLDRLLEELPAAQMEAIRLVKIEGLSVREAAEQAGQSESLVKVNIHRGLKKLKNVIEKA